MAKETHNLETHNLETHNYFKIIPIKTDTKLRSNERNDSFGEFQRIWGPLYTSNFSKSKDIHRKSSAPSRHLIDVKTIQLEIPTFGLESAIINTNKNLRKSRKRQQIKKEVSSPKQPTKTEHVAISAKSLVKKLSLMEHFLRDNSKISTDPSTSKMLDLTNKELELANQQIVQIQQMIEKRKAQAQRIQSSTPACHYIKTSTRHKDCVQRKYISNMQSMNRKLKEIKNKYLKNPQVKYRSVNDIFKQIYRSEEYNSEPKLFKDDNNLDEYLKVPMSQELENIVNAKTKNELQSSSKSVKEDNKINGSNPYFHKEPEPLDTLNRSSLDFTDQTQKCIENTNSFPKKLFIEDSGEKAYNKMIEEYISSIPKRTTTPVSPFGSRHKPTDHYSHIVENFLAKNDENDDSTNSSVSNSPGRDEPKYYKVEHVLARNWSVGNQIDKDLEQLPKPNTTEIKEKKKIESDKEKSQNLQLEKYTTTKFEEIGKYTNKRCDKLDEVSKESTKLSNIVNDPENIGDLLSYSFKKPICSKASDKTDLISHIIDSSEKRLNKYRHLKQNVIDVNTFCDTLCNIVNSDDEDQEVENNSKARDITLKCVLDNPNTIFDDTKLQDSVLKSSYLMKEFNIKPRIFVEESPRFYKSSFFANAKQYKGSGDNMIMEDLLNNLDSALDNSVFKLDTIINDASKSTVFE